jgi:hypothetical protein
MKRFYSLYYIPFFLCALLILISTPLALAQEPPSRIEITDLDTDQFPQIDIHIAAIAENGGRYPGLFADMISITENVADRVPSVYDTPRGTELIFVIDADTVAQENWSDIRSAIEGYASVSWMDEELDYVTLIVSDGQSSETLVERTQFYTGVSNAFITESGTYYEPRTLPTTSVYDLLGGVLTGLPDEAPNPGMYRALVFFSSGDTAGDTNASQQVSALAQEKDIRLYTVLLGEAPGGEFILSELSQASGGQFYRFDSASSATPMWEVLTSHRQQYTISYRSQIVASGFHSVQVTVAGLQVSDNFEITVLEPQVEITLPEPNTEIIRVAPDSGGQPSDYEPRTQAVKYLWTWPDQHERQVDMIQLRVNGAVQAQLDLTASDDRNLVWDMSALPPGPYSLRVEVIDELGLMGQSTEIPVVVTLQDEATAESTPSPAPDLTATPSPGIMTSVTDMAKSALNWIKRNLGCIAGSGFSIGALILAAFVFQRRMAGLGRSPISWIRRQSFFRPIEAILRPIERVIGPIRIKKPEKKEKDEKKEKADKPDKAPSRAPGRDRPGQRIAWLEVITGQTKEPGPIQLSTELTFGRSSERAQVVFSDRTISRLHSRITPEHGGKFRVFNYSNQSTWVNEQRVPEHGLQLNDGDMIRMGRVQLRFRIERR